MNTKDLKALNTIYLEKKGLMSDLKNLITTEMVDKLISVGFISCGYNETAKTWRLSSLGREYYEDFVCHER